MIFRYRLWDLQTSRYMATGYNAKNKKELTDDYASYKSNDWDEIGSEDEEGMHEYWARMTMKQKMDYIRDDEFEIERSFILPFKENWDN